jgi:hypothetical protein
VSRLSRTPAIVLRAIDYSETSQVLHLYTREHGKRHCIAKGSKRAKSAFHGAFDLLGVYDVIRLEKQPGSLDLLTQAEAVKEYRAVRADLGRFGAACWMAEFVDEMTGEAIPQPELYDLLKASIESSGSTKTRRWRRPSSSFSAARSRCWATNPGWTSAVCASRDSRAPRRISARATAASSARGASRTTRRACSSSGRSSTRWPRSARGGRSTCP